MLFYAVNALIVLLSSLLVSVVAFSIHRPRGKARIVLMYILALVGAAIGVIIYTAFPVSQLSRIVRFFIQFGVSLTLSALIVFAYFAIRGLPDAE
jgi:uncharacterized membrane protein YeaQ/YmgE (transglycosylase-associated protein family)